MSQSELFTRDGNNPKDKKTLKLLAALGSIGCNKDMLSVLVDFAGVQVPKGQFESRLDAMRYLRGPLVIHGTAWAGSLPEWMASQAVAERSEIVLGNSPYLVGPTEIAAVMYPATMEHPMRHDAVELYLWAAVNACCKQYHRTLKEQWKMVGHDPIADKEVIQHGGRLWQDYSQLAWEIRRKVISAQADREKEPRQTNQESKPTVITQQMELL